MKQFAFGLGRLAGSLVMIDGAQVAPIALTWEGTVAGGGSIPPSTFSIGDPITLTLSVDNGGADAISQNWSTSDVISASIGAVGGSSHRNHIVFLQAPAYSRRMETRRLRG